jgi:hypothetical protein
MAQMARILSLTSTSDLIASENDIGGVVRLQDVKAAIR